MVAEQMTTAEQELYELKAQLGAILNDFQAAADVSLAAEQNPKLEAASRRNAAIRRYVYDNIVKRLEPLAEHVGHTDAF